MENLPSSDDGVATEKPKKQITDKIEIDAVKRLCLGARRQVWLIDFGSRQESRSVTQSSIVWGDRSQVMLCISSKFLFGTECGCSARKTLCFTMISEFVMR